MNFFILFSTNAGVNLASYLTFHHDSLRGLILKQYEIYLKKKMLSNSVFGAMQWHIPILKHLLVKKCRTCISSQRRCWWKGRHLLGVPWDFLLKPQYSHILCVRDREWINLGSWGTWLEMQEATLQTFSGLKWKRMTLSWAVFFLLFPMSKQGDYSYQW